MSVWQQGVISERSRILAILEEYRTEHWQELRVNDIIGDLIAKI